MKPIGLSIFLWGCLFGLVRAEAPLKALMITGGCCHEYQKQKTILSQGIAARAKVTFTVVHQGGTTTNTKIPLHTDPNWAEGYDLVVHNECFAGVTDPAWVRNVLKPHQEGLPAVVIHCAMHCYRDKTDEWFKFLGVTSHRHGAHYPFDVMNLAKDDPIMEGFGDRWMTPQGELYLISKVWDTATPLAHAMSRDSKKNEVCVWKNHYGKARVFGTTIGHHSETMEHETYLDMVTRGLLWAAGKLDDEHLQPNRGTVYVEKPYVGMVKDTNPTKPEIDPKYLKEAPENLAAGKPTSASASQGERDPKYAVDGLIDTRWCPPDNGVGYWWQVDLEKEESIEGFRIVWEQPNRTYQYKVEGSRDGKAWSMLWDMTGFGKKEQVHEIRKKASGVHYVRLTLTKVEPGAWGSIWEFEVYGPKLVKRLVPSPGESDPATAASPGQILKNVKVPEGFTASFYAGPPYVSYPACLAAAPNGEVFVGVDPNGSLGKDPNHFGKVVRCVDEDGDGTADSFNDFIPKIPSVRGLFYDNGSLWVLHPPYLKVFHDDDRDGTADRHEVLVEGLESPALKQRGADHCTNGFRVGIDGWIYIAVGDFGAVSAKGADGKVVQLHGGGILRVRMDGSELELYVHGLRNIYDVAVDPFLNAFTRDNTNDGGGWNVRLSHIVGGEARYGYPSLFKNFTDERIPPLADYGGGSPCGSLFLDEPGYPEGLGTALYTCDWGRSVVFRHPLKVDGAGFVAEQEDFVTVSRPTDMDVDGLGRLFISSWDKGGFSFKSPDVGFVIQVAPEGHKPEAFPDMNKATDQALLEHLTLKSQVLRLHAQQEILRRDAQGALLKGVTDLALKGEGAAQVAAIFTLKQWLNEKSHRILVQVGGEHALRALTDRVTQCEGIPAEIFANGTESRDARVRLQAAIGLGRLGDPRHAGTLVPLLNDSDHRVAHVATRSLIKLEASETALSALDGATPEQAPALARAIQEWHSPDHVEGLANRVDRYPDGPKLQALIQALARLYHREKEWQGSWWGTRPDTSGPYYVHETWEQSPAIEAAIRKAMAKAGVETASFLHAELKKNKITLKGLPAAGSRPARDLAAESKRDADMVAKALKTSVEDPAGKLIVGMKPEAVVAKVQTIKGDPKRGEKLFQLQACFACHTTAEGQPLKGPHLAAIGKRYDRKQLAESVLAPNAVVAQGFATHWFKRKDGLEQEGFVVREAGDEVEIRNIAGVVAILKKDQIKERGVRESSSMPEGLVWGLTVEDFAGLLAYLESLK